MPKSLEGRSLLKEARDHSKQERNEAKLNHTAGTAQNTIAGELGA
jgi:hypothetical protein